MTARGLERWGALLLLPIFLTGCWDNFQMNQLAIVDALAVDYNRGQYHVVAEVFNTMAVPAPAQSSPTATGGSNHSSSVFLEGAGKTLGEALADVSASSSRHVFWASTQVLLLGTGALQQGLGPLFGTFLHYPQFRSTARVLAVPGSAQSALESDTSGMEITVAQEIRNQDRYLHHDLSQGWAPRLYDVMRWDTEHGRSMVLLSLEKKPESKMNPQFRMDQSLVIGPDGRARGSLPSHDAMAYLWITGRFSQGYVAAGCPAGAGQTTIYLTSVSARSHVVVQRGTVRGIHIRLTGTGKVAGPLCANLSGLNMAANRRMVSLTMQTVDWAEAHDADIFGWGQQIYRQTPELWNDMPGYWRSRFPHMPVSVTSHVTIVQGDEGRV